MTLGTLLAITGAVMCATLAGIGSARGVNMGGQAASGVLSEQPELFGKLLVIQALPGTQGIYGFLTAVLVISRVGVLGGNMLELTTLQGLSLFAATLPIGVVGMFSAIYQAKVAVSSIHMTAKQPDSSARGITMTALVETYAILALLVSILMVFGVKL